MILYDITQLYNIIYILYMHGMYIVVFFCITTPWVSRCTTDQFVEVSRSPRSVKAEEKTVLSESKDTPKPGTAVRIGLQKEALFLALT